MWAVIGGLVLVAALAGGLALALRGSDPDGSHTTEFAVRPSSSPASSLSSSEPPATPTPPSSFASLYRKASSGVVRIETTACGGGGVGSGFLVAPDMVATVAHVVKGAESLVVRYGHATTTGTVVGFSPDEELALVRTDARIEGHVFDLARARPPVGIDVAAIGYPLGGPKSMTKGSVSGLGRTILVEGQRLRGLIQTDVALNPGNSGGPLLDLEGRVVGLVEAKTDGADDLGFAVAAPSAADQLGTWLASPSPVTWPAACGAPVGPDGVSVSVTDHTNHPDAPGIAAAFSTYANGINVGDYAAAYSVLGAQAQARTSFAEFSQGTASSYIVAFSLENITRQAGSDLVSADFISVQSPEYGVNGQHCSRWRMTYTMVRAGGPWLIDRADSEAGSPEGC